MASNYLRRLAALAVLFGALAIASGLVAVDASATVLCKTATNPCTGGTYGKGTTFEASLKAGTESVLDAAIGKVKCSEGTIKGEVTNGGGEGANASGTLSSFSLGKCNAEVKVLKNGTFAIEATSGGNGTLKLEGLETTVEGFGFHCIFSGSTSISLQGGEMASLSSPTALKRTGGRSGAFCGESASWTAEYTVTAPEPLWVSEKAVPSTVLCKTATNPCAGSAYSKGTVLEASLKAETKWILKAGFGEVKCSTGTLKGEVTSTAGVAGEVTGTVTGLSLGDCNCAVKVLKNGTFTIDSPSGNNGTFRSSGLELTTECLSTHCVFSTSTTDLGTVNGGAMASFAATGTVPRTGGTSGESCGSSGTLAVEYTVTAPEPLYVEEPAIPPSVLCKTATNPCTGGTYGKGSTIEASLKAGTESVLDAAIGKVKCSEGTIKGEVTNGGGEGANASGTLSSFSLGKCNAEVKVLKNGTFAIEATSGGNGTLKLEGLETTVEGFGFHCIFSGSTSISLQGGEMASLSSPTALKRTGGRSGAFCGESASWTAEYTVTAPEPLYVEGI